MGRQAAEQILSNFTALTAINAKWQSRKASNDSGIDGYIQLNHKKGKIVLPAIVRKAIHYYQFPDIYQLNKLHKGILVLAADILPKMRKDLKEAGINYIDIAGNAFIQNDHLFILLDGHKKPKNDEEFKTKLFSKAGLKVIFQLFLTPDLINSTIREIADHAEVSLDSAHKTLNGIKELMYVMKMDKDTLYWHKRRSLLQRWITEYDTRLKPTIQIGRFRFLNETDFSKWHEIPLKPGVTIWGGEAAGDLYTNYLHPQILTLYTTEGKFDMIRNYRIIPDPEGYIMVYTKFWKDNGEYKNLVPPFLAYADLINTGDSRCIETAERIYDKCLKESFKQF